MPKKVNPNKIPRTQADVNRARTEGIHEGVRSAMAIMLTVLCDKFNGGDHIPDVWKETAKLSEEIKEGRVSIGDLIHTLNTEYDILV